MAENKFVLFSEGQADGDEKERDRRRHRRYRIGVLTEIGSAEQGSLPGITFNMSASGAYLLTLAPLSPGDEVTLTFLSAGDEKEVKVGRVVHGAELKEDLFWSQGVGVEFVDGVPKFFAVEFDPAQGEDQ